MNMALSKEDKGDVKGAFGKAIANKIEKATRDYGGAAHNRKAQKLRDANPERFVEREKRLRAENDMKSGNYVKLKPTQSARGSNSFTNVTAFSPYRKGKDTPSKWADASKGLSKKDKERGYSM